MASLLILLGHARLQSKEDRPTDPSAFPRARDHCKVILHEGDRRLLEASRNLVQESIFIGKHAGITESCEDRLLLTRPLKAETGESGLPPED